MAACGEEAPFYPGAATASICSAAQETCILVTSHTSPGAGSPCQVPDSPVSPAVRVADPPWTRSPQATLGFQRSHSHNCPH